MNRRDQSGSRMERPVHVSPAEGGGSIAAAYQSLKRAYAENIKPLEEHYHYDSFFNLPLTDMDIEAKPFVLLIGQYSVGKTSFINHLLGDPPKGYPGSNVGPEPTTDRFVAITHGAADRVTPGNAAAVNPNMPFTGLQAFGNAFLQKFQVAEMRSSILDHVTLIDTPGVLSGEKQRIGRNYDMPQVCRWFAERSDLVLLLFDAHKLDISDELKDVIEALRGHDDKIRIVLNKSDQVSPRQLLRVYGSLMWSLGKVFKTPEVSRVYISSFWKVPYSDKNTGVHEIFDQEKEDLFRDLLDIPRYAAVRRVNEVVKRARTAKVHALVCATIRQMMPAVWGGEKRQREIVGNLDVVFTAVSIEHGIPPGDFPDVSVYKKRLDLWLETGKSLRSMPKLDKPLIDRLDECLKVQLSELMGLLANPRWSEGADEAASFLPRRLALGTTPPHGSRAWEAGGDQQLVSVVRGERDALLREKDALRSEKLQREQDAIRSERESVRAELHALRSDRDALFAGNKRPVTPSAGGEGGVDMRNTPPRLSSTGKGVRVGAAQPKGSGGWGLLGRGMGGGVQRTVVRAKQRYVAAGADELTYDEGDEIEVKEEHPSGWWKGQRLVNGAAFGAEGLFPSNTVEPA